MGRCLFYLKGGSSVERLLKTLRSRFFLAAFCIVLEFAQLMTVFIMSEYKLKTGKLGAKIVNAYKGIEDKFVDTFLEEDGSLKTGIMAEKATSAYQKIEDAVVGGCFVFPLDILIFENIIKT